MSDHRERDGLHGVHREERIFALPPRAVNTVLATLLSEALGQDESLSVDETREVGETRVFAVETRSWLGALRLSARTTIRHEGDLSVEVTAETLDSAIVLIAALAFAVATGGAGLLVLVLFSGSLAKERVRRRAALVGAVLGVLEAMEREPLGSYRTSAYAVPT